MKEERREGVKRGENEEREGGRRKEVATVRNYSFLETWLDRERANKPLLPVTP